MEFYSAMKKNEILSFAGKWMELENIILSKVSQAQKTKNCMFSLICGEWGQQQSCKVSSLVSPKHFAWPCFLHRYLLQLNSIPVHPTSGLLDGRVKGEEI
jgi:hypothetical protein